MVLVFGFDCKLLCMVLSVFFVELRYIDLFNYFFHLHYYTQKM